MKSESELDQKIWAVIGATRVFEGPYRYADAQFAQRAADAEFPKESFVITTAEAAARAIANDANNNQTETVCDDRADRGDARVA